jgi:Flp pilus assembly pilin Flp
MHNFVEKFTPEAVEATDEDGVVAIEYVLLAAMVAIAVIALATPLGGLAGRLTTIIASTVAN